MKTKKKDNLPTIGLTIFLFLFAVLLFTLAFLVKFSITGVVRTETENITPTLLGDCQNLSLFNFTECIVKFVKPHYNYTHRNLVERYVGDEVYHIKEKNLEKNKSAFQDILDNGGDCTEWAYIYRTLAVSFGYNYTNVFVPNHVYIVIADETGYCDLDGVEVRCREYAE